MVGGKPSICICSKVSQPLDYVAIWATDNNYENVFKDGVTHCVLGPLGLGAVFRCNLYFGLKVPYFYHICNVEKSLATPHLARCS